MTELVDASEIERVVGADRHPTEHRGRAVSEEQMVYVLHSWACRNVRKDLRECPFSLALDRGILEADWAGQEDRAVTLGIWHRRLIPAHLLEDAAQVRS